MQFIGTFSSTASLLMQLLISNRIVYNLLELLRELVHNLHLDFLHLLIKPLYSLGVSYLFSVTLFFLV